MTRRLRQVELKVQKLLLGGNGMPFPSLHDEVVGSQEDAQKNQEELVLSIQRNEVARYGSFASSN
jgi:hypothetical protein